MLEYFLAFIKQHHLIAPKERVILALSGGVDSMTMADLFLKSPFSFAVGHINYQLRGKESEKDFVLVKQWSEQNKIPFYTQIAPKEIFKKKDSVQMAARNFRYEFFNQLLEKESYHKIVTAHHQDDSLETALFNFTKGTGLRGLVGMAPKSDQIIRPMLFTKKEEIIAYAEKNGLSWREDASNKKDIYQRNKLRHKVIPVLKQINPGILKTFATVSQRISDAQDLLTQQTEEVKATSLKMNNQVTTLSLPWMDRYTNPKAILSEILRTFGFSYAQVLDIYEACIQKHPGKMFHSDSHELDVDRDHLIIQPIKDRPIVNESLVVPGTQSVNHLTFETSIVGGNDFHDQRDPSIAYVDLSKLKQLKVTSWKAGDVFQPLGMKGKKKVSDFMIDSKIPLSLKRDVLIVRSHHDIVWVVGHRIDERFKVTPETHKMLRIQLKQDV